MRASVLVLGPLLARAGSVRVSLPGGCAIGARPINLHLAAFEKLGAEVRLDHGYVEAKASRLTGAEIVFDTVTVTGTENVMLAATLARGTTRLVNAAREPEVADLARMLVAMGAKIRGAGSETHRNRRRREPARRRRTRSSPTASRPAPTSWRPPPRAATSSSASAPRSISPR